LLLGQPSVPRRTVLLTAVVGATSFVWFAAARLLRLNSDGPGYTAVTALASLLLFLATMAWIHRSRQRPSLAASALAHGTLFVWLVSYAWPWFGEVP
jgi:hypothetical protein